MFIVNLYLSFEHIILSIGILSEFRNSIYDKLQSRFQHSCCPMDLIGILTCVSNLNSNIKFLFLMLASGTFSSINRTSYLRLAPESKATSD